MSRAISKYDVPAAEMTRGRRLKMAAVSSPILLTAVPAAVTLLLLFTVAGSPPAAATIFFFGLLITVVGFVKGLILSGLFAYKYSKWTKETRELIARDGIRAEELDWFRRELRPAEKRVLKELERGDPLLADAYRETLASRLTASRIIRSSQRELQVTRQRENRLKLMKTENASRFLEELKSDTEKIRKINSEAKEMLVEAESRLQMIEAAAFRGGGLVDSEVALKKLSARSTSLPLALEEAKMTQDIVEELEKELADPERRLIESK
jgi:hypothetical protein